MKTEKDECTEKSRKNEEIILDHVWNLFNFLEDKDYGPFVDSVYYFVNHHGFDIGVLPDRLHDIIENKVKDDFFMG